MANNIAQQRRPTSVPNGAPMLHSALKDAPMITLNADQARIVGFEFYDVRLLCRAVHIPTADRDPRGSLRIVG